jgi:hypothetical protein
MEMGTPGTPIKRRLTAILAADAVGYSRQMSENEERTLQVLAAQRAIIDRILAPGTSAPGLATARGTAVRLKGRDVLLRFEGTCANGQYTLSGHQGTRNCTMIVRRDGH